MHVPVSRRLGQKHVSYLLVLTADNCYLGYCYTALRITIHKVQKPRPIYIEYSGQKKGFKPTHK